VLRQVLLLPEPAQRSPDIRFVVRQGLGPDAKAGVMQLADRDPDRGPAGGDHRGRAVKKFWQFAVVSKPGAVGTLPIDR
jgi:hypothetical protein